MDRDEIDWSGASEDLMEDMEKKAKFGRSVGVHGDSF
jgi:hypothetical protein